MGIQINGTNDTISAADGSLDVSGYKLTGPSNIDVTGIVTTSQLNIEASSPQLRLEDTDTNGYAAVLCDNNGSIYLDADGGNTQSNSSIRFRIDGGGEKARIDSSGRLLVGTASARSTFNTNQTLQVQLEGTDYPTSSAGIVRNSNNTGAPAFALGKTRGTTAGSHTVVNSGDDLGTLSFEGADGSKLVPGARITAQVDGTPGSNDMPGRLVFSTTADSASSPTERMRITNSGEVRIEVQLWNKGPLYLGSSGQTGSRFFTSSTGSSSTTMYIGNAAIQVSSDIRLKENVVDTAVDASEELKKVRIVDFTWNDPTDVSHNNRNARGTWTGLIAQELIDVFPFAVNAPRREDDLSVDNDSEDRWTVDQDQLVPVLIKGFQQALARIETLETANATQAATIAAIEARLTALEAQ